LQYTFVKWSNCNCGAEINYYITQDGGHSWPGGTQTAIGDPPSTFISANDLMWDFFQLHSLTCDSTTAIEESILNIENGAAYPNPTSSSITVFCKNRSSLTIYNSYGNIVVNENGLPEGNKIINISKLPDGIYFIKLEQLNAVPVNHKIIKLSKN
jgi:polyhydroxybutyrate depolymerase